MPEPFGKMLCFAITIYTVLLISSLFGLLLKPCDTQADHTHTLRKRLLFIGGQAANSHTHFSISSLWKGNQMLMGCFTAFRWSPEGRDHGHRAGSGNQLIPQREREREKEIDWGRGGGFQSMVESSSSALYLLPGKQRYTCRLKQEATI